MRCNKCGAYIDTKTNEGFCIICSNYQNQQIIILNEIFDRLASLKAQAQNESHSLDYGNRARAIVRIIEYDKIIELLNRLT